jgi:excisionase family DNA binding protein
MNAAARAIGKLTTGEGQDGAMELVQGRIVDERNRRAGAELPASRTVMTLQEIADYLRVTRSTIHRLLKRNQIPAFRIGRHWRFNVEEIDNWCSSRMLTRDPKADA